MPTIITHGLFAASLAHVFKHASLPLRFWVLAMVCSMLPDTDVSHSQDGHNHPTL